MIIAPVLLAIIVHLYSMASVSGSEVDSFTIRPHMMAESFPYGI